MDGIRRLIVVGAGVAGLACAAAAARAGVDVQVFEAQSSSVRASAHIDVVPNLLRDLSLLGVAEQCQRKAFAYSKLALADHQGRVLAELSLRRLAGARQPAAFGMRYEDFLEALEAHAISSGAQIERSAVVTAVDPEGAAVVLADSRAFSADLVLLAAGRAAALSKDLCKPDAHALLDQEWIYGITSRAPGLDQPTWLLHHSGAKAFWVPVGMREAGLALTVPRPQHPSTENTQAAWRSQLARFPALGRALMHRKDGPPELFVRPVRVSVLRQWHQARMLCVGDCAHTMPPHFGQAAAQSLEDAVVLSELLASNLDAEQLVERFSKRRIPRASRVAELVGQAARWDARPDEGTNLLALAEELSAFTAQPA